jgi:methyltransferase (TIGR00027 family)
MPAGASVDTEYHPQEMVSEDRPASRTAILTAVARALHREEPPPWVLDDYLAVALAGDEGGAIRAELVATLPPENLLSFTRWMCARARYPEDLVERSVRTGSETQYVILGAGLDTFAYRRRDLRDDLRVFEVDHPESQAWKRSRLDAAGVAVPENLVFAPVDFENQPLREGLERAGVDFARPTIVSWIGVTMYLSSQAIDAALGAVARFPPDSRLVLTYNLPLDALTGLDRATAVAVSAVLAGMGEPFVTLFRPREIDDVLRRHGYGDIEHFGPNEALVAYFGDRPDVRRLGVPQRLLTATMTANP